MEVQSFAVNLTSEQPEPLFAFYRDVVGLPPQPDMGDHALVLGGATLFVDGHSATKGAARSLSARCSTCSSPTSSRSRRALRSPA